MIAINRDRFGFYALCGMALMLLMTAYGCDKKDVITPDVPAIKEAVVTAVAQVEDARGGVLNRKTIPANEQGIIGDIVSVSGQGKYKTGETVKVTATVRDGYSLLGYYFEYTNAGEYNKSQYPSERAKLLKATAKGELSFAVHADITVIAVIQKADPTVPEEEDETTPDDEPLVQKEPFQVIPTIDVEYWKAQNQRAWDMIYPKIVRLSEKEEWEMIERYDWDLKELCPALEEVLHTDTIYSGETNMISYRISIRQARASEEGMEDQAIRMAYALADMNGNIVQIYPPFRQDTYPKNVSYPVYVDLPEGDYIQKVLIQIPEDPNKWYDLRLHDTLFDISFYDAAKKIDKNERFYKYLPTLPNPNSYFVFYKLPKDLLWWNDKTITRHIVTRKSVDKAPIPGWTNTHFFNPDGTERRYGSMAYVALENVDKTFTVKMTLSNKSNAYRKGTMHAMVVRNTWIAQNRDIFEKLYLAGNNSQTGEYDNRIEDMYSAGNAQVIFRGEENKEITLGIKCTERISGYMALPGAENYLVFYWQPEGENRLYFMTQDFSKVLNRLQERTDVPFGEFWAGSTFTRNPNIECLDGWLGDYLPILGKNVLYEEFQTYMDGNGVFIE